MSELFTRPQYFREAIFHRHTDRTIGWLELFYDLVYVATLIQIGNFLSDNLSLLGFAQFLVMMFVVWWAWTAETLYQNRFVADDIWHRILVFIQIFGVAAMGLSVSAAFGELYVQFTLGYVLVRTIMILMYARIYRAYPDSQVFTRRYMVGFGGGIAIWLIGLLLPAEYHWVAWLVAIAFETIFFGLPAMVEELSHWDVDAHHMVERFGIFTIIVLGEAFVKVLDDAQGASLGMQQILFGISALIVLYGLWWLYFSDTSGPLPNESTSTKLLGWTYGHLFLAASLVSFGVGVKKLFAETIKYPGDPLTAKYRFLFTAAIVIFLIALAAIDYGTMDEETALMNRRKIVAYGTGSVLVLIVGLLITGATATQFAVIVAAIMLMLVGHNIYRSVPTAGH